MPTPLTEGHGRSTGLVDVLDRVLDKGLVVAGDIKVSLAEVELLTIRIRLLICSIDKAEQIGLDWWKFDHHLSPGKQALSAENEELRKQVRALERQLASLTRRRSAPASGKRPRARAEARHKECSMPVERAAGGTSLIDVLDRVLDKGIVIDAWVRVSLVGIDLITVEARIVVASIDTYLKYSEAVGQVAPVSKPAIEGKGYEEVIAENAALRAQLKCASPPAALLAVGAPRGPRLSATGRRRTRASRASASRSRSRRTATTASSSRRACACSKGFVSRTEIADCAQLALQWLGDVARHLANRSAWSGPSGEQSLFVVGASRAAGIGASRRSASRSTTGATRSSPRSPTASELFFPAPHSAADRKRRPTTPFEDAAFHVVPLGVSGLLRRGVRPAAGRRRPPRCRPSCTGSPTSSARSSIRSCASRR